MNTHNAEKRELPESPPGPLSASRRFLLGSIGWLIVALGVGGALAEQWTLVAVSIVAAFAAQVWAAMPLYRAQRDPMLRSMGLTPWAVRRTNENEAGLARL